jgi:hypothetical protein
MTVSTKHYMTILFVTMFFVPSLTGGHCLAQPDYAAAITPTAYGRGIIPLTPGSSTTLQNTPGEARTFITVLALGQGTLKATLSKKDTTNDVISMLLIGYPAEPAFVPGFGITPADVVVSAATTDALGGYGIFFIVTTINSTETYASSLSLKLE